MRRRWRPARSRRPTSSGSSRVMPEIKSLGSKEEDKSKLLEKRGVFARRVGRAHRARHGCRPGAQALPRLRGREGQGRRRGRAAVHGPHRGGAEREVGARRPRRPASPRSLRMAPGVGPGLRNPGARLGSARPNRREPHAPHSPSSPRHTRSPSLARGRPSGRRRGRRAAHPAGRALRQPRPRGRAAEPRRHGDLVARARGRRS